MAASHRIPRLLALPTLVLLAAAGCADAPAGAHAGFTGAAWVARPDLRIGSVDDPVYGLTRPTDLLVAGDGTMYSAHANEQRVRVWAPDGTAAGEIGGPGEGPGEFQAVASMGFHGDTLWVFDSRQYRTTYFDRDGELLGVESPGVNLGEPDALPPPRPARPLRDGSYLARPVAFSSLVASGEMESGAWVRRTADGDVLDTTFVQGFGTNGLLALERDDGGTYTSQPFGDDEIVAQDLASGGLLVVRRGAAAEEAERGRVEVLRLEPDGDTAWVREMRFDVAPVTEAQADSAVDAIAGNLHEWLGERMDVGLGYFRDGVREALYLPPHHPPVTDARVGRDGTAWIALSEATRAAGAEDAGAAEGDAAEPGTLWLVLASDGSDLATVELPAGLTLLEADREHVWAVETDELDVPYIVRMAVEPGS